jgi:saccharopine dehydrogenase (NAD+, L-lysine-forming)
LLADTLADLGSRIVLGARDGRALAPLAKRLGLEYRVFGLSSPSSVDNALADIFLVLNAAGPFQATARPMINACLRTRTHYLDLAGEWPIFAYAMGRSAEAAAAGIMLMPGVGFGIAVTDCALALAAARARDPVRLRLGLSRPHALSRGSVATVIDLAPLHALERRQGRLRKISFGRSTHDFEFGDDGLERCTAIAWPDVVTAEFSTGVSTVEAFSRMTAPARMAGTVAAAAGPLLVHPLAKSVMRRATEFWPRNPGMIDGGLRIVAQAEDRWRRVTTIRLVTADGYATTTITAAAAVRRVLMGEYRPGFSTPSALLGRDFIFTLPDAVHEIDRPSLEKGAFQHAGY